MLLETDPAAAARCAGQLLSRWPAHEAASLLLAAACRRLGDAAPAVALLESLTDASPHSPILQLERGRAYAAAGRGADASAALRLAVELDPALAEAWRELAALRFLEGDTGGGDAAYLCYSRLASNPPELGDAHAALAANRLELAQALVSARLRESPQDAAALWLLAEVQARRGDRMQTETVLRQCLAAAPGHAAARHELARLLYAQQRVSEALPLIERLLATDPHNVEYLTLKAQAIRLVGRNDEAIALMESLTRQHPEDAQTWLVYGNVLREVGEQPRSIAAYRRALEVRADFGEAYWALANLKTFRFSVAELDTLRSRLQQSAADGSSRIHLEFALGKACEDAGLYAESFEHYSLGNMLHRESMEYDPAVNTADLVRTKEVFTRRFFADRAGWGSERTDPIFIVGLPRSGSTLLEQILASHPDVEGTRELLDVPTIVRELAARPDNPNEPQYPHMLASLTRAEVEGFAARYLDQTAALRPSGSPRFTDKMLSNFRHVGLLQLMFPHASIIDARRHPLGCGLSCYKQLFGWGVNFSYDLRELGLYYRDYVDLMEHMDAVLPGRVHRVQYERLVADPDTEVRRLLDYCRLPFDAGCLRFYDNRRVVQTMSSEQVRRPIYTEGVDQWRHFDPWLGPLKEALG